MIKQLGKSKIEFTVFGTICCWKVVPFVTGLEKLEPLNEFGAGAKHKLRANWELATLRLFGCIALKIKNYALRFNEVKNFLEDKKFWYISYLL